MTPLKKRRFARESLSIESPPAIAPTPSTPCNGGDDLITLNPANIEADADIDDVGAAAVRNGYKVPTAVQPVNDNLFEVGILFSSR